MTEPTEVNGERATAAPRCITTWQAELLLEHDHLPMPISGDATTKAREYPKGWIMADCL